jgi:hypothetical protein
VQNNKHNQVTSTYYLLLKKKERVTGKNYVFEQVTFEKRKNLYSTSNLKGNFSNGLEFGLSSTQKLFGATYARSEGRAGVPGSQDFRDVRSHGGSSTNTNQRDESIHKRVTDIISLPSKAITPANASQMKMQAGLNQKIGMTTFNTNSIKPHLNPALGPQTSNPRVAQSHSPTNLHRKQANESATRGQVNVKQTLASMNQTQTFHSG